MNAPPNVGEKGCGVGDRKPEKQKRKKKVLWGITPISKYRPVFPNSMPLDAGSLWLARLEGVKPNSSGARLRELGSSIHPRASN